MKVRNCWLICAGLVLALALICGSAKGSIPLPLPLAVVIGLGINAGLALWQHRLKMEEILGSSQR